jgi:hypothetical protein
MITARAYVSSEDVQRLVSGKSLTINLPPGVETLNIIPKDEQTASRLAFLGALRTLLTRK